MSNIEEINDRDSLDVKDKSLTPIEPKSKVSEVLQELEIMAMQKGSRNFIDTSKFNSNQVDKLLDTLSENEKNAFAYHSKRIDAIKEIELKKIDASVINQKTIKIVSIGSILFIIPLITLLILFYKETYFIPWLTFLSGILGGFGLSKITSRLFYQPEPGNPINEEDNDNK
jgi:hypothetical protein